MTDEIPYLLENTREWMKDAWTHDKHLLDKFFPTDPIYETTYQEVRLKYFNSNSRYNRWKNISKDPKPMSRLCRSLTNLLNAILREFDIGRNKRLFLNSHTRHRSPSKPLPIRPGIMLSGVGSEFSTMTTTVISDRYGSCISPLEVVWDSDDLTEARERLAVHVHRIFQQQDSRRFIFGLVITQNTFTVFMFDHSGVVASDPCNYHVEQDRFCSVICGLAGNGINIGFDPTMFSDGVYSRIRTSDVKDGEIVTGTQYIVEECIFQYQSFLGRGTVCWLASPEEDRRSKFVIKDAWITPADFSGRESEETLLRHAYRRGVFNGVIRLHHFEKIRRSEDPSDLDTVLRNRLVENPSPETSKLNGTHVRMVISPYSPTLDDFDTREELLFAFHDAVLAHRRLHEVAGILHRDISVRNILINLDGEEENRGILIDFDHAIRIDDDSPYSKQPRIGTWRYMSRNALGGTVPHTYLDDLESFYYVLCYILAVFECPGILRPTQPEIIMGWDLRSAHNLKTGVLVDNFNIPLSPWFGKALHDLVARLHRFFQKRGPIPENHLSKLDSKKDYDEFLAEIRRGIDDLAEEFKPESNESVTPVEQASSSEYAPLLTVKQARRNRRRRLTPPAPPPPKVPRPRRKSANYGLPNVHRAVSS